MTAAQNAARATKIADIACQAFAMSRSWNAQPEDMEARIGRMMKRGVPPEFQPRRAPRNEWVRTQSPDIAARNRSMAELSAQGMTSAEIGKLFGVTAHYARAVIRGMEAKA